MIDQAHPFDEDLEAQQHRDEVEERITRHAPAGTPTYAIAAAVRAELGEVPANVLEPDVPAPLEQRDAPAPDPRPSILAIEREAARSLAASRARREHRRSWLLDLARAVAIATFAVAFILTLYAWLMAPHAGAAVVVPREHRAAPVFLAGVAPAGVESEARRITRGIVRYATGAPILSGRVLGCAPMPQRRRLPWVCLSRLELEGTHCDVVTAIGHVPLDHRRGGRVVRTTYLKAWGAQRFRTVFGPCES